MIHKVVLELTKVAAETGAQTHPAHRVFAKATGTLQQARPVPAYYT